MALTDDIRHGAGIDRDPAALIALAMRIEGQGRYNLAKLLRAAADAIVRRGAHDLLFELPGVPLQERLDGLSDAWADDAHLAPLVPSLRRAAVRLADDAVPLMADAPDPLVCRRCGHLVADAVTPEACPVCLAEGTTFLVQRPVSWLDEHDHVAALAALERTPQRLAALLRAIPQDRWRVQPEPQSWSPHEVLVHLRDAQGVLAHRVDRILDEDDPELHVAMVWTWAHAGEGDDTEGVLRTYLDSRRAVLERLRAAPLEAWWRTGRHQEFGPLTLTQQVSYFAAHEPTHLRQVRSALRNGGQ
jgi:uncharacterized damage-inducible protein DinB